MKAEEIMAEIRAIPSSLAGDVTDAQAGLIMYLTKEAFIKCQFDDNPIVELIWRDCRVTELSKADAGRFITYFGDKGDEGWDVQRLQEMTVLHRAWMETKGQQSLFDW